MATLPHERIPWTKARKALDVALSSKLPVLLTSHTKPVALLIRLPLSWEIANRPRPEWEKELREQIDRALEEALA